MNLLGFDLETTGLDTANDRIIEFGGVIWNTEHNTPLALYSNFVNPGPSYLPLSAEVKKITGIQENWLADYGTSIMKIDEDISHLIKRFDVQFLVAHNGINYDRPLLDAELRRHMGAGGLINSLPLLDTRQDLPFKEEPQSRRLSHLAMDAGFLNPFPHRALCDVLTMMKLLSQYSLDEVVAQSKIPFIIVRALVSYEDRQLAKDMRFSWEAIGEKKYPKMWVSQIRENKLDEIQKRADEKGFKIVRIE